MKVIIISIINNEETIEAIKKECGRNTKLSLSRASMITRGEEDVLNTTITIPVYGNLQFNLIKLTSIPKIIKENLIEVPKHEATHIGVTVNSHQYIEINNLGNTCTQEENKYFCKTNSIKTFNVETSSCAAKAIFGNNTSEGCRTQKILLEDGHFYQKITSSGDYLYVMTRSTDALIECQGTQRVQKLNNTGIISIDEEL